MIPRYFEEGIGDRSSRFHQKYTACEQVAGTVLHQERVVLFDLLHVALTKT
jgi:hypothetical protein